jgi:hypothetical protein
MPLPQMKTVVCRKHGRSPLCHVNVDGSHADVEWCTCHGDRVSSGCPIDTHNQLLQASLLRTLRRTDEAHDVALAAQFDYAPKNRSKQLELPLLTGLPA